MNTIREMAQQYLVLYEAAGNAIVRDVENGILRGEGNALRTKADKIWDQLLAAPALSLPDLLLKARTLMLDAAAEGEDEDYLNNAEKILFAIVADIDRLAGQSDA